MNKLRKIGERLWLYKERMVFAAMVVVLCWYVYKALNPPEQEDDILMVLPKSEVGSEVGGVEWPPPPAARRPVDWSSIHKRSPFWYFSTPGATEQNDRGEQDARISLLNIRVVSGRPRAQLQTESSKKWYDEGESFESFELLKIDPEAETCDVYSERLGKVVILELPRG